MPCGTDRAGVVGRGCRAGMLRFQVFAQREFGAGTLGCFNPASKAGGLPSLHADGRAFDAAFDGHTREGWDAGWRLFTWCIDHADEIGLQEILFGGYLWSCLNRHLGIRGPGIQQPEHMNHVHIGLTYDAANNFDESWVRPAPAPPKPPAPTGRACLMLLIRDTDLNMSAITPGHIEPCTGTAYVAMAKAGVPHLEDVQPLLAVAIAQAWGVKFS